MAASNSDKEYIRELSRRYESQRRSGRSVYFDADDFDCLIEYYFDLNEMDKSHDLIESALRIHPSSENLKLRRAEWFLNSDKPKKCLRLLDELADNEDVRLVRSSALIALQRSEEALDILRRTVDETSDSVDLLCLDISDILLFYGMYAEALSFIDRGIEANPSNTELYGVAVECTDNLNDYERSKSYLRRWLDLDSFDVKAWLLLGSISFDARQYEDTVEAYEYADALLSKPLPTMLMQLGDAYAWLGRTQEALETYRRTLDLLDDPLDQSTLMGCIAQCYEKQKAYDEALQWYDKALELDSEDEQVLIGKGVCYMDMTLYDEALETYEQVLKINEENAEVWHYIGDYFIAVEQFDNAVAAYEKAIDMKPSDQYTLVQLGTLYFQRGDFQRSVDYFLKAADSGKPIPRIYAFLAADYTLMGKDNEAEYMLKKALELSPDAANLYNMLITDDEEESRRNG